MTSGLNPQGISVTSFKAPGPHELAHDFLWRVSAALPARGMIGIFNRSHYEEVLVARVHEEILKKEGLPPELADRKDVWNERLADIAAYEAYLGRQGTRILKIFLNVSKKEQKERFLSRLEEPDKNWKFNAADIRERELWPKYQDAYAAAIAGTAAPEAPWFVVPADRKWLARILVAEVILEALEGLDLKPPVLAETEKAEFEEARKALSD